MSALDQKQTCAVQLSDDMLSRADEIKWELAEDGGTVSL